MSVELGDTEGLLDDTWWCHKCKKFIREDFLYSEIPGGGDHPCRRHQRSSSGIFKTKIRVDKCIRRLMLEDKCGRVVVTQFLAYSDTKGHLTREAVYWWGV